MRSRILLGALATMGAPQVAFAEATKRVGDAGVSGIWLLANFSYAGMRAQGNPSAGWRIISFIFGFPGTLLSMFLIEEGSERAYGVELPRADRHERFIPIPPDENS